MKLVPVVLGPSELVDQGGEEDEGVLEKDGDPGVDLRRLEPLASAWNG